MDKKTFLIAALAALVAAGAGYKAGEVRERRQTAIYKERAANAEEALKLVRQSLGKGKVAYKDYNRLLEEAGRELKKNPLLAEKIDAAIQRSLFDAMYVDFEHQTLRNLVRSESEKNPAFQSRVTRALPEFNRGSRSR